MTLLDRSHRRWTLAFLGIAVGAIAACDSADQGPAGLQQRSDSDRVLFIAQNELPNAVMEALFVGRVTVDRVGCVRLASADPATVIWPHRFTLDGTTVKDHRGTTIGHIGGEFRLGGGEIGSLHDGIKLSSADRALVLDRCPGRFWIVGEVPQ